MRARVLRQTTGPLLVAARGTAEPGLIGAADADMATFPRRQT
ncbi:hypothetical protein [Tabrizicola sp.]|nr:hypothetical protein [Tabrizicola sp.]